MNQGKLVAVKFKVHFLGILLEFWELSSVLNYPSITSPAILTHSIEIEPFSSVKYETKFPRYFPAIENVTSEGR